VKTEKRKGKIGTALGEGGYERGGDLGFFFGVHRAEVEE
jgi:hypothetical protein